MVNLFVNLSTGLISNFDLIDVSSDGGDEVHHETRKEWQGYTQSKAINRG